MEPPTRAEHCGTLCINVKALGRRAISQRGALRRCARSPCRPKLQGLHGSRTYRILRCRTGAFWFAQWRLGVCGTDREIIAGEYGWARPGRSRLVLGHESLGRVEEAPPDIDIGPGDWVVGIVRRPDPVPCPACARGEWDMCRNGRYTERGIKERHGFGAELFRVEPEFAIRIDPALGILGVLLEPASILAKAWDHTEQIGKRSRAWQPRTLMVTGAGPIGLLAALMGAQRGLDVHVLNHHASDIKSSLVRDLGGTFHLDGVAAIDRVGPDILMECTGAPGLIRNILPRRIRRSHLSYGRHFGRKLPQLRHRALQSRNGPQQRGGVRHGQRKSLAL
jgi:threonine dehydrogenase-like Zn-dependent dehydrogenase